MIWYSIIISVKIRTDNKSPKYQLYLVPVLLILNIARPMMNNLLAKPLLKTQ